MVGAVKNDLCERSLKVLFCSTNTCFCGYLFVIGSNGMATNVGIPRKVK